MKIKLTRKVFAQLITLALLASFVGAQQPASQQQEKTRQRTVNGQSAGQDAKQTTPQTDGQPTGGQKSVEPTPSATTDTDGNAKQTVGDPSAVPPEARANRREQMSEEEAAVLPYYNNFMTTYRLGPEDVISVTVFGQERYSKSGIVIPPDGRIAYPLIPEGIFVAGKTTQQVQEELSKRLNEYIIDPKISVSLEKAVSARYSVLGDVGQPGIRVMSRRLSVYEALAEAGGVLSTGDKSKVFILRRQSDGTLRPIPVNVKDIERGRAKEMAYLVPGDQVIVPGNRLKTINQILGYLPVLSFARIFTGGL